MSDNGMATHADYERVAKEQAERRRADAQRAHREKIKSGKIDLGPITHHEPITEDIRDMRDPQAHGEALLYQRQRNLKAPLHEIADVLDRPNQRAKAPKTESYSRAEEEREAHIEEYRVRGQQGDKAAQAAYEILFHGGSLDDLPKEPEDT